MLLDWVAAIAERREQLEDFRDDRLVRALVEEPEAGGPGSGVSVLRQRACDAAARVARATIRVRQ